MSAEHEPNSRIRGAFAGLKDRLENFKRNASRLRTVGKIAGVGVGLSLGLIAAGCGSENKAPERSRPSGTPVEHASKKNSTSQKPSTDATTNPDNPSAGQPVKNIDLSTDLCSDKELDSTMRSAIDYGVYCVKAIDQPAGSITGWLLDQYQLSDLPVPGAMKGTIMLLDAPTNVNQRYEHAISSGGTAVTVDGMNCSFKGKAYNMSCFTDEYVAAVNINGDKQATIDTYSQVMDMAVQAAAR